MGGWGEDSGDFLENHFSGVPAAGVHLAEDWGPLEKSLVPSQCGACHPQQFADWSGSRHSLAMSPGVLGQLLDKPEGFDVCNRCHAPLLEQRPFAGGVASPETFREDLRAVGLACPSCHVRDGEVHGPTAGAPTESFPHGGYTQHEAFEGTAFCGTCHQFPEDGRRVAGVLLEDTVNEWMASPWGQREEPCQSCHMPDRRHLWRGIHDPEFTEQGLDIALVSSGRRGAVYSVTSIGVGHRFPTYVTPRVTLTIQAVDAAGEIVARNHTTLQRRVDIRLESQTFDTRLHPGETAVAELAWSRSDRAVRVEAKLLVEPDEFYRRFYEAYRTDDPRVAALISEARQETATNTYIIGARSLDL